ncbi:hypothetical protein AS034_18355 [[Bacillus] enclensis]|jgi:uncharacterized protein YutE (UPF0331/DUF86 family)|uniref:Uncharacterized conserved protein YutE, UPF0331/DUF86 family n=2 Tax=Rossellomorea TaxID=2837508 RepID=A0A0V8HA34_9BACI|nr:DUF86 domain-containing protein [[Bacillus] enclensis]KSU59397.1 hypothetical protein AS034_18355 [[Bacillus] enclensis]MBH9965743.1 DUF86 domain-containing protein [[Bacillus] enclensis]QTC40043.1 DUF86 domain-containing protein [Bacillus sp. V3]SCC29939.1 Uncharacterized conserved protein YutE, UPF0331/DUF86 family [[Bacillus] enclensis]
MYFVDRDKIEERLVYMNDQLSVFNAGSTWESTVETLALERIGHTLIESVLDVGNSMIDGFIMRDPGSYEDIIDILLDEKVIDEGMSKDLKRLIDQRKILVQEYTKVDRNELNEILTEVKPTLEQFPVHIRRYLENELGPVSAFKN